MIGLLLFSAQSMQNALNAHYLSCDIRVDSIIKNIPDELVTELSNRNIRAPALWYIFDILKRHPDYKESLLFVALEKTKSSDDNVLILTAMRALSGLCSKEDMEKACEVAQKFCMDNKVNGSFINILRFFTHRYKENTGSEVVKLIEWHRGISESSISAQCIEDVFDIIDSIQSDCSKEGQEEIINAAKDKVISGDLTELSKEIDTLWRAVPEPVCVEENKFPRPVEHPASKTEKVLFRELDTGLVRFLRIDLLVLNSKLTEVAGLIQSFIKKHEIRDRDHVIDTSILFDNKNDRSQLDANLSVILRLLCPPIRDVEYYSQVMNMDDEKHEELFQILRGLDVVGASAWSEFKSSYLNDPWDFVPQEKRGSTKLVLGCGQYDKADNSGDGCLLDHSDALTVSIDASENPDLFLNALDLGWINGLADGQLTEILDEEGLLKNEELRNALAHKMAPNCVIYN